MSESENRGVGDLATGTLVLGSQTWRQPEEASTASGERERERERERESMTGWVFLSDLECC